MGKRRHKSDEIILEIRGGLGNQMFQYALYKNLARKKNVRCIITNNQDNQYLKLVIFPKLRIEYADMTVYERLLSEFERRGIIKKIFQKITHTQIVYTQNDKKKIDDYIFRTKRGIIRGYFQNEKYFEEVREEVAADFDFPYGEKKLQDFVASLRGSSVSVHIRRGDYLNMQDIYGGICTKEYYNRAFNIIEEKIDNPNYVVLSDDKIWAKEFFINRNVVVVTEDMFDDYSDWYDMYIMSKCAHNITANSSFSWWGAWLNPNAKKIVVAPKRYNNLHVSGDTACDGWIKI